MTDMLPSRGVHAEILGSLRTTLHSALNYVDLFPSFTNSLGVTAGQALPVHGLQIRALINERRRRDDFFSPDLFSDPAWDMLLELYAKFLEQQRTTTTELCMSAAVPCTTALRWIKILDHEGLISRQGDMLDARRVFVELSLKGRTKMEAYFEGKA